MEPNQVDVKDGGNLDGAWEEARRAVDHYLNRRLAPDAAAVSLSALMAEAFTAAVEAIAVPAPDGRRVVAAEVARAAVPSVFQPLIDWILEQPDEASDEIEEEELQGDDGHAQVTQEIDREKVDVSDPAELAEKVTELIDNDEIVPIDRLVKEVLGGSRSIGEVWEDASYAPGLESETLYLEAFTWKNAVWYYGYGCPDVMEPYDADFLCMEGDVDGERAALVRLAGNWMGAGLENHDDPDVRRMARSESWIVNGGFNWYDPFDDWNVDGNDGSSDGNIKDYGELIAARLGRDLSEVAAALRTLDPPDDDDVDADDAAHPGGDFGRDLPDIEQLVRRELWWILKRS